MSACVYRFYDANDTLLYVGCTTNVAVRLDTHRSLAPWFTEAARVTLEHFAATSDAGMAELIAIRRENPKYNISGGRDRQAAKRALAARRALWKTRGLWLATLPLEPYGEIVA